MSKPRYTALDTAAWLHAATRAGAVHAGSRYACKLASAIPGLMTPDEIAANERAERLVPIPLSGPLHSRGYAEVPDSPGAAPPLPPPPPGGTYSPEERNLIVRTALERMGRVSQERADRDNLAAGGHLRIASAPWIEPTLAKKDYDQAFASAGAGVGLTSTGRTVESLPGQRRTPEMGAALTGTLHGADISQLTATAFATLARRDAKARKMRAELSNDPLGDQRARQRMYGHNDVPGSGWGPAFSAQRSDGFAAPVSGAM